MRDRMAKTEEKAMLERLRQEDLDARPQFSAALHERICRAVRERSNAPRPIAPEAAAKRRTALRWAIAAAAAACVAGALVWVGQAFRTVPQVAQPYNGTVDQHIPENPEPPKDRPPVVPPSAPPVDLSAVTSLPRQVSTGIPALVEDTIAARRWAYLDHDARLTMEMLASRIPLGLAMASSEPKPDAPEGL